MHATAEVTPRYTVGLAREQSPGTDIALLYNGDRDPFSSLPEYTMVMNKKQAGVFKDDSSRACWGRVQPSRGRLLVVV